LPFAGELHSLGGKRISTRGEAPRLAPSLGGDMAEHALSCPECGSSRVNVSDRGGRRCLACGKQWKAPTGARETSPNRDYVRGLRQDRFARQEPGVLWNREA
jgi:hypothetical protein